MESVSDIKVEPNICRVCMISNANNMLDIFGPLLINAQTIGENITFCTGLELSNTDGYPSVLCELCYKDLITACKFKTTCLQTDEVLRRREIKIEPIDNDNYDEPSNTNPYLIIKTETDQQEETEKPKEDIKKNNKKNKSKVLNERPKAAKNDQPEVSSVTKNYLKCNVCNLSFDTKEQSKAHRKTHDPKYVICEICGLKFLKRSSYYYHIKTHLSPKYQCDQCDYKTINKHDLAKHMRMHSGIKQFQCEFCTTSYCVVSNLKAHINRCHKKLKRYTCHLCSYMFYDKTKLGLHIDSHNDIKRHHCDYCGSNFARITYLRKHLRRHHDVSTIKTRPGRHTNHTVIGDVDNDFTLMDYPKSSVTEDCSVISLNKET